MSILGRPKRKQGIKKRAIKKFADSYRVGIAYMGLAELRLKNKHEDTHSYYFRHSYDYKGVVNTKDMAFGEITAEVTLTVTQKHYRKDGARDFDISPPNRYNDITQEQYDVMSHNIEGLVTNEFSAKIYYDHHSEISGNYEMIYVHDVGTYYSIEDVLNAISTESEVAWGEVAIKLREYAEELVHHRSTSNYFPDTIQLSVPENTLVLTKRKEGNWYGKCDYSKDGIRLNVFAKINAIPYDEDGELYHSWRLGSTTYSVSRDESIGGYHVEVGGRIADENTQVSYVLRNPEFDTWQRKFENQGAETLDGAKAIAEANIRELYQEFMDYLNSERNYVQESNGRGYARTTRNTNEWNYNIGDTWDDVNYLNWQEGEHGYPYEASTKKSKSVPQFSSVVAKLRKKE